MKYFNFYALSLVSLIVLQSCSQPLEIEIYNRTNESIVVLVEKKQFYIGINESATFRLTQTDFQRFHKEGHLKFSLIVEFNERRNYYYFPVDSIYKYLSKVMEIEKRLPSKLVFHLRSDGNFHFVGHPGFFGEYPSLEKFPLKPIP